MCQSLDRNAMQFKLYTIYHANQIFSLLPYNFSNMIATIHFLSAAAPPSSTYGQQAWASRNFGNLIIEIQNFLTPAITSFLSPLLYFFRILIILLKFASFLIFSINFQ